MFWLYILQCGDGSFYIGHTDDMDERMRQHEQGVADSYTLVRKPLRLLFAQEFESRYEALSMERKLERLEPCKKTGLYGRRLERNHQVGQRQAPT